MATYSDIETWEPYEGGVDAYNFAGDQVASIDPLENSTLSAKWGESYTSGRSWVVFTEEGEMVRGWSKDLRQAKKDVISRLQG